MRTRPLIVCVALFAALACCGAPTRPELRFGAPTSVEAARPGYVRGESCGHYTRWVGEYLTRRKLLGAKISRENFGFTGDVDDGPEFRALPRDYENHRFDEGHYAPAGDMHTEAAMRSSFLFSNCGPQTPELNRGPWRDLERTVRRLAIDGAKVTVFTGPAFVPDAEGHLVIRTIGPHNVWVPTHFWKACLIERASMIELRAWLAPNTSSPGQPVNWSVSTDELEATLGLDFWSRLPRQKQAELEAADSSDQ